MNDSVAILLYDALRDAKIARGLLKADQRGRIPESNRLAMEHVGYVIEHLEGAAILQRARDREDE